MENSKKQIQQQETAEPLTLEPLTLEPLTAEPLIPVTTTTTETNKLKKFINSPHATTSNASAGTAMEYQKLDKILERENSNNKMEIWSKLDKTQKILRLNNFADRYGQEHGFEPPEVRALKTFFVASLDKGKLQRVKDVIYDKERREIQSIPALVTDSTTTTVAMATINGSERHFTLRNLDTKRVSTLKSLGRGASFRNPLSSSSSSL
jgi:hypothetical protein